MMGVTPSRAMEPLRTSCSTSSTNLQGTAPRVHDTSRMQLLHIRPHMYHATPCVVSSVVHWYQPLLLACLVRLCRLSCRSCALSYLSCDLRP
jgi:hypothetical protein